MQCDSHKDLEDRLLDIGAKLCRVMEYPEVSEGIVGVPTKDLQYLCDLAEQLHKDFAAVDITNLIERVKESLAALSNKRGLDAA